MPRASPPASTSARITGTLATEITTGNGGVATFTYSAPAPNTLVLSGGFDIAGGTRVQCRQRHRHQRQQRRARRDRSHRRRRRHLRPAENRQRHPQTRRRKHLRRRHRRSKKASSPSPRTARSAIPPRRSPSTAVASPAPLRSSSPATSRSARMAATSAPTKFHQTLEIAGALDWSDGTTTIDGSGRTVISGSTSGPGGNLVIGSPHRLRHRHHQFQLLELPRLPARSGRTSRRKPQHHQQRRARTGQWQLHPSARHRPRRSAAPHILRRRLGGCRRGPQCQHRRRGFLVVVGPDITGLSSTNPPSASARSSSAAFPAPTPWSSRIRSISTTSSQCVSRRIITNDGSRRGGRPHFRRSRTLLFAQ